MKKPFEVYINFIENELGIKLLCWQKAVLESIYDGYFPQISCVRVGKMVMERAAELLAEEIDRDEGLLPARLYGLDGYVIDIVTCDENWGENIIWEKENNNERK